MKEIESKFELIYSDKRAGGWGWNCKKCNIAAFSKEVWFPCQEKFVIVKLICPKCKARWKLEITPDDVKDKIVQ